MSIVAAQVNSFVEDDLLKPLLNILMSTPAGSSISKVPELEILSTLARHEEHQKGKDFCNSIIKIMIWNSGLSGMLLPD